MQPDLEVPAVERLPAGDDFVRILDFAVVWVRGTVSSTGAFDEDVTAGLGFIALAAVIMGRWHPVWAAFAALAFGLLRDLRDQLGLLGDKVPGDLISMLPYLATVIAVAGFVGRVRAPAADGEPYVKG